MSVVVRLGFNRLGGALTTPHPIFVSGNGLQVCPAALTETSIYASGRVPGPKVADSAAQN